MIKKIGLLCIFIIVGCSVKPGGGNWFFEGPVQGDDNLLIPEEITINMYNEIGLLQVIKKNIYKYPNIDMDLLVKSATHNGGWQKDGSFIPRFCYDPRFLIGGRIIAPENHEKGVDAECLYERSGLWHIVYIFSKSFFYIEDQGHRLLFRYVGDSLHIESPNMYGHKKLKEKHVVEKKDSGSSRIRESGTIYEFYLMTSSMVSSLTIFTNPQRLKGYKPLRLDPSILPLESPGYKKLREQEESRMKGD